MGDEGAPPYTWVSQEPLPEGAEAPVEAKFVKSAGRSVRMRIRDDCTMSLAINNPFAIFLLQS